MPRRSRILGSRIATRLGGRSAVSDRLAGDVFQAARANASPAAGALFSPRLGARVEGFSCAAARLRVGFDPGAPRSSGPRAGYALRRWAGRPRSPAANADAIGQPEARGVPLSAAGAKVLSSDRGHWRAWAQAEASCDRLFAQVHEHWPHLAGGWREPVPAAEHASAPPAELSEIANGFARLLLGQITTRGDAASKTPHINACREGGRARSRRASVGFREGFLQR